MAGLPVTIRLLDPPLHEFLPHTDEDGRAVAEAPACRVEAAAPGAEAARVQPDAGPSRLPAGVSYPEIYEMQARAIFEAACEVEADG
jgi:pyruvate,orthophosphate dikinase